jgi:thymidylate kinase
MTGAAMGKVFALEGTSGSGKTTLIKMIRERMPKPEKEGVIMLPEVAESIMGIFPLGRRATVETEIALLSGEAVRVERMQQLILNSTDVIADRCWISNTVLSQVRARITPGYSFNPNLYATQERVFQILYPTLFTNTVLIFLDLPAEVTFERQPWRLNMSDRVLETYAAYSQHIAYLDEQEPLWITTAAERASAPPPPPPPPGVAAPLPEPVLSPYAGIERIDARQPIEHVFEQLNIIFHQYTGRDLSKVAS